MTKSDAFSHTMRVIPPFISGSDKSKNDKAKKIEELQIK